MFFNIVVEYSFLICRLIFSCLRDGGDKRRMAVPEGEGCALSGRRLRQWAAGGMSEKKIKKRLFALKSLISKKMSNFVGSLLKATRIK